MKKFLSVLIVFGLLAVFSDGYSQVKKNTYGKQYGYFEVAPSGGVIFPVGTLSENYDVGGRGGLNLGYRINREVAAYVEVQYNSLSSKVENGSNEDFISFTGGPRYYFTNPKLKSTIFLEGGLGGYMFPDEKLPGSTAENSSLRFGVNAGIGADIYLSKSVGVILKTKYTDILGGDARSFLGIDAGINVHL